MVANATPNSPTAATPAASAGPVKITSAGSTEVSCEVNLVASSEALVDSAEVGKKPALSFC